MPMVLDLSLVGAAVKTALMGAWLALVSLQKKGQDANFFEQYCPPRFRGSDRAEQRGVFRALAMTVTVILENYVPGDRSESSLQPLHTWWDDCFALSARGTPRRICKLGQPSAGGRSMEQFLPDRWVGADGLLAKHILSQSASKDVTGPTAVVFGVVDLLEAVSEVYPAGVASYEVIAAEILGHLANVLVCRHYAIHQIPPGPGRLSEDFLEEVTDFAIAAPRSFPEKEAPIE